MHVVKGGSNLYAQVVSGLIKHCPASSITADACVGSSQPGLVKAIQLMVAEMKGTQAVHCCLEVDQSQEKQLSHKTVSTCLALRSRSGAPWWQVVCPEQTDTPKGKPCNVKQSVYMSIT